MPSMNKVQHIKSNSPKLSTFVIDVNKEIDELNKLISAYNISEIEDRVEKLKKIQQHKQYIEHKYSDKYISACPAFSTQIFNKLFLSIKQESSNCGINNLYRITNPEKSQTPNTFAEILVNMEPQILNKLILVLSKGSNFSSQTFSNIFSPNHNKEFEEFLRENSISFLGGGNSQNFKITPNDGTTPYVLKLENRMGMPNLPAAKLKETLKNRITSVYAERQGTVKSSTTTVMITDFCSGGDLLVHSEKCIDNNKRAISALNMYDQMSEVLINMTKEGCAFPDMKNENWLVDLNNELMITDTKSFVFIEKDKSIDYRKITKQSDGNFVQSKWMNPPEIYTHLAKGKNISSDKMHAFMIGKNLYKYLTRCSNYHLAYNKKSFAQSDFDYPVFQTPIGMELKNIIQKTVTTSPEDRMSLAEVRLNLKKIECFSIILYEVERSWIGEGLDEFIHETTKKILNANEIGEIEDINQELNEILNPPKNKKQVKEKFVKFKNEVQNVRGNDLETGSINSIKRKN